jgi:ABC-type uncharacterized transport system ATPase subunit
VPERFPGGLAFSARDYLMHLGRIHGLRGPSVTVAVDEWLDRLGATDYAGSPLRTLSKGMCQKVAIAQALLSKPDLLVLDEAWTGLDQAARGALDAAVGERVAAGGTVMFVDHHQARLAGQVSQRWVLGKGRVRMLAGAGQAAASPAHSTSAGGLVLIELAGLDPESAAQLTGLAGVVEVRAVPGAARAGARLLLVSEAASDGLLRQLLGWDGVHVVGVGPASPGRPA